jgi:hypothetical protein
MCHLDDGVTVEPYLLQRNPLDSRFEHAKNYPMPGSNVMGGLKVTL